MKYPFIVVYMQEDLDNYWVAKSSCLKGCIGQGNTPEEAISELAENEITWLETAAEFGIEIPEIPIEKENEYSGKLSLRMSPSVHMKAADMAKRQGISLNQYVNDAVVNYTAELRSADYISVQVAQKANNIGMNFLSGITASESSSRMSIRPAIKITAHYCS